MLERFKQELRLARRITHRNVVRTYDLGETGGTYYITMELVRGTTLATFIHEAGRLDVAATLTIGKQLCRALEVAHEEGIVHRDIKPQNLLVDPAGFLKVMDFGIARLAEAVPVRRRGTDRGRRGGGHAAVHGAGAAVRRAGGSPDRLLCGRSGAVRMRHRDGWCSIRPAWWRCSPAT